MDKTGIALFVYNRPEHTKKTLEGIKKNSIKHLYVFSDGPKNEADKIKVEQIRSLIKTLDWCETELIISEYNKGLAESLMFGFNYVLERHERIIVLEDDCVAASSFIRFMEQCLDKYENEEKVMSITGFGRKIKLPANYPYDIYFVYRSGSHSTATWRRAWKYYERNPEDFQKIADSKKLRKELDKAGLDLFYIFKSQIEGMVDSAHIWWSWSIIKNNGVCIVPVQSRIQDIGHDGTGTHGSVTDKHWIPLKDGGNDDMIIFPDRIEVNKKINKKFNEYVTGSYLEKLLKYLKKLKQVH